MEKIKQQQFGEASNYLQMMEKVPMIFSRIIVLENLVNELIDKINATDPRLQQKAADSTGKAPSASGQPSAVPQHPVSDAGQNTTTSASIGPAPEVKPAGAVGTIPGRAS